MYRFIRERNHKKETGKKEKNKCPNKDKAQPYPSADLCCPTSLDSSPIVPWIPALLWVILQYFPFLWKPHISLLLLMHHQSSSLSNGQTIIATLLTTPELSYSSPSQNATKLQNRMATSNISVGCLNASVSVNNPPSKQNKEHKSQYYFKRHPLWCPLQSYPVYLTWPRITGAWGNSGTT